jgi:hypothetical protein
MNHQNSIGENEVARPQSTGKRADDAGPDHQLRRGNQIERATRRIGCALVPDSVADNRELLATDLRAEAMQAVEREWRAIAEPPLERRDLASEGIEEKNQLRDLIPALWIGA